MILCSLVRGYQNLRRNHIIRQYGNITQNNSLQLFTTMEIWYIIYYVLPYNEKTVRPDGTCFSGELLH
jgi:hypothetical protein